MMPSTEFICVKGRHETLCRGCKIDEAGLCSRFRMFVKKYLVRYIGNEIEKEIAHKTFDAVFQNVHALENKRFFWAYCKEILKNNKAEVFRLKSKMLERENLRFEGQFTSSGDDEDNGDWSILDHNQLQSGEPLWPADRSALAREVLAALENMVLEADRATSRCARLLLNWVSFDREGLSQKEMADRMGEKQNTFNQRLRRCKELIAARFA
jgi:DNA-directed RNA polymerase specialized sigma24 family protein